MRPPSFWLNPPARPGVWPRVLAPLSLIYGRITAHRIARAPDYVAPVPVICVGNVNLGGTGKTPTAIAVCQLLQEMGITAHVVMRGYKGQMDGPIQVDPMRHDADAVGDEALLLAAFAPVWVAKDRAAGVRAAVAEKAQTIILDDGMQNPSVAKDFTILVVDAAVGFGNGRIFPAGPLREPHVAGVARSDAVLLIGAPKDRAGFSFDDTPVWAAEISPLQTGMDWAGERFVAFAGIGRPEKFFDTLRGLGANVLEAHALADHAKLSAALLRRLEASANAKNAQLVCTEKDAVRLPAQWRSKVVTLPVRLTLKDPDRVRAALRALFDKG